MVVLVDIENVGLGNTGLGLCAAYLVDKKYNLPVVMAISKV